MKLSLATKILIPVTLCLVLAVTVVSVIGFLNISLEIDRVMAVTTQSIVDSVIEDTRAARQEANFLKTSLNGNYLRIARAVAVLLEESPRMLQTSRMQELAQRVGVSEIYVIDRRGVLFAGSVPGFFGFDFATEDQTRPFLELIGDPTRELAQDPQRRATDGTLFQYIGVSRRGLPGIVQIGVEPKELESLVKISEIQYILDQLKLEEGSYAYVVDPQTTKVTHHTLPDRVGRKYSDYDFGRKIL